MGFFQCSSARKWPGYIEILVIYTIELLPSPANLPTIWKFKYKNITLQNVRYNLFWWWFHSITVYLYLTKFWSVCLLHLLFFFIGVKNMWLLSRARETLACSRHSFGKIEQNSRWHDTRGWSEKSRRLA